MTARVKFLFVVQQQGHSTEPQTAKSTAAVLTAAA